MLVWVMNEPALFSGSLSLLREETARGTTKDSVYLPSTSGSVFPSSKLQENYFSPKSSLVLDLFEVKLKTGGV